MRTLATLTLLSAWTAVALPPVPASGYIETCSG